MPPRLPKLVAALLLFWLAGVAAAQSLVPNSFHRSDDEPGVSVLLYHSPASRPLRTAWVAVPVADPETPGRRIEIADLAETRPEGWSARYEEPTGCLHFQRVEPVAYREPAAFADELTGFLSLLRAREHTPLALLDAPSADLGGIYPEGRSAVAPPDEFPGYRFEEPLPFEGGTLRRPVVQDDTRPKLLVRGPRYAGARGPAFVLLALHVWRELADRYDVELLHRPDGLYLRLAPTEDAGVPTGSEHAWAMKALDDLAHTAAWSPDRHDLEDTRRQMFLQRALSFEDSRIRLAFIARRLRFERPEAVWAEEAALRAVIPADIDRAARALLLPEWQLTLPPPAAESIPHRLTVDSIHRPGDWFSFTIDTVPGSGTAALCLLVALPGQEPPAVTRRSGIWPFRSRKEVTPHWAVREEAALLWRAKASQALARHPDLRDRVSLLFPSPVPGVTSDPLGSNQFSALALQTTDENASALLRLGAAILREDPTAAALQAAAGQVVDAMDEERYELYRQHLDEQVALAGSLSGRAALRRRAEFMAGLLARGDLSGGLFGRGEGPSLRDLEEAHRTLFGADGNLYISLSAGHAMHEEAEDTAQWLRDRRARIERPLTTGAETPYTLPRWEVPEPTLVKTLERNQTVASMLLPLSIDHRDEAKLILLNQLFTGRGFASPFIAIRAASLNFAGETVWFVQTPIAPEADPAEIVEKLRQTLERALDPDFAPMDSLLDEARAEALYRRLLGAARLNQRAFFHARDALLHGDPYRRHLVDAALQEATLDDVRSFAEHLLTTLRAADFRSEPAAAAP